MTGRSHPVDRVPGLQALAQKQLGVVRRDQLRDLGITRDHVRRQVDAQRWTVIGPRAVVLFTGPLRRDQRRAVGLAHAGPLSALAGLTSLEALGLRGWERDAVHILVPQGHCPPRLAGVVVHQTRHLDDRDLAPGSRLRCAAPARATVDAASWERAGRTAAGLVLAAVQQRVARVLDVLVELERPGPMRHRAVLRSLLSEAASGADSMAEVDVARMVVAVGLPRPRRQVVVETPDGPRCVDLVVDLPDGRVLVIEVDGVHHDDPRAREGDAIKDAALVALGYLILRIPVSLLRTAPDTVRGQLEAIARSARRGVS